MSTQAVTISSAADPSGAFTVSGVFWLTAPANNVVPQPNFRSAVPNILPPDLAALRSGQIVEVPFTAPSGFGASGAQSYPASTTQAQIDSDILAMLNAAQSALSNANPSLSTVINRSYNGTVWTPYGGTVPPIRIDVTPSVMTPLLLAVAQGLEPNMVAGRAVGYVSTAATSGQKIQATAYNLQTTAAQRSLVSTSTADAAAGTGAQTVIINYLNASFQLKQDTVTLNGTTAVATNATDIQYVESLIVATVGTGGINAGTITLGTTAAGGTAIASIAIGDGQTNIAHHYVPSGKTCLITSVFFGATVVAGRGSINHSGNPSATNLPPLPIGGQYSHVAGGNVDHVFQVPVTIVGPDRIFLIETPNTTTASVAFGAFEYVQM